MDTHHERLNRLSNKEIERRIKENLPEGVLLRTWQEDPIKYMDIEAVVFDKKINKLRKINMKLAL